MKLGKLAGLLKAVAPTMGQALAGPLGGTALTTVAKVLGVEPEQKAVEQAIDKATPKQLGEIRKAELAFEAQMAEIGVDVFALEVEDVKEARKTFAGDYTQRIFGLCALAGFLGYIFLVTVQPPDQNSDTIVSLVLGYLGGLVSGISAFYFGASQKNQ